MLEEEVTADVEIKSPASKFHMLLGRAQHLPKATRYVQGCDLLEGEWGKVGNIILWKLIFDGEQRVSKDRIEMIDFENNVIQYRILDGPLKKEYKSVLKTMKATPKQGGLGSVVEWNLKYERVDEKVAHPEKLLKFLVEATKEVDQYLMSEEEGTRLLDLI